MVSKALFITLFSVPMSIASLPSDFCFGAYFTKSERWHGCQG